MKSVLFLITLLHFGYANAASTCTGRFTPFEMLKVGVDNTWVTLKSVTEHRECESIYGKIKCGDWKKSTYAKPFLGSLELKLVSSNKSVTTQGTFYRKTKGNFTWLNRKTLLKLEVKKDIFIRGACLQWGASGGVRHGYCRSYATESKEVFVGEFKGRVSEDCVDLLGPVTKSDSTYFSDNTFVYTEVRKSLKN